MSETYLVDRCPKCGKPRLHDEPVCGHCRHRWPKPIPAPPVVNPADPSLYGGFNGSAAGRNPKLLGNLLLAGCVAIWFAGCSVMSAINRSGPSPIPAPPAQSTAYVPPPPGEAHASGGEPTEQVTDLSAYQGSYPDQGSYGGYYGRRSHSSFRDYDGEARTEHVSGYTRRDGTYVHSYNRRPRHR